jgi:hypothetical protein
MFHKIRIGVGIGITGNIVTLVCHVFGHPGLVTDLDGFISFTIPTGHGAIAVLAFSTIMVSIALLTIADNIPAGFARGAFTVAGDAETGRTVLAVSDVASTVFAPVTILARSTLTIAVNSQAGAAVFTTWRFVAIFAPEIAAALVTLVAAPVAFAGAGTVTLFTIVAGAVLAVAGLTILAKEAGTNGAIGAVIIGIGLGFAILVFDSLAVRPFV